MENKVVNNSSWRMFVKFLFLLVLGVWVLPVNAQESTELKQGVVCQQQQAWLVNNSHAVPLGRCRGGSWIAILHLTPELETVTLPRATKKREREVLSLLGKTTKDNFAPVTLEKAGVKSNSQNSKVTVSYLTIKQQLPEYMQEFLSQRENESLSLIVTIGVYMEYFKRYEESSRYTIEVKGSDPTIAEILQEAKDKLTNPYLQDHKESLGLTAENLEPLDVTKRASDYKLKNNSILRLFSGTR